MPDEPGPPPTTNELCRRLAHDLGMDGVAVAMLTGDGDRDLVHATDDVIAHLDELQFSLAEGPCLDAYRTQAPALADDLTDAASRSRWPVFAERATAAGAGSAFAFPLTSGDVAFGVLELYRRTPGALTAADVRVLETGVRAVTRVALDELSGARPVDPAAAPRSWPGGLSTAHAEVHQAAGVLAVHLQTSVADAMARLRAAAYTQGTSVADLAGRVLAGTTSLDRDDPA